MKPRREAPTDWFAIGRALRAEVGALEPAALSDLLKRRWPALPDEAVYALAVGYACGDGSRGPGGSIG